MVSPFSPIPEIFAPALFKKFARSCTSGSRAASSIIVVPSANTAADMTLQVPSTVEPYFPFREISVPFNLSTKILQYFRLRPDIDNVGYSLYPGWAVQQQTGCHNRQGSVFCSVDSHTSL